MQILLKHFLLHGRSNHRTPPRICLPMSSSITQTPATILQKKLRGKEIMSFAMRQNGLRWSAPEQRLGYFSFLQRPFRRFVPRKDISLPLNRHSGYWVESNRNLLPVVFHRCREHGRIARSCLQIKCFSCGDFGDKGDSCQKAQWILCHAHGKYEHMQWRCPVTYDLHLDILYNQD